MKKFRRSSKRNASTPVVTQPTPPLKGRTPTSFFSLPAELRIAIYNLHVADVSLSVVTPAASNKKSKPLPPSLLLACHQARSEYLPILLSTAPISFTITELDFRPLIRLLGGLRRAELIALRKNDALVINLILTKFRNVDVTHFRRWLAKRSEHMDRLAWDYEIDEERPIGVADRLMALTAYLHAMADLHKSLHESLLFEMEPVEDALKGEHAEQSRVGKGRAGTTRDWVGFR